MGLRLVLDTSAILSGMDFTEEIYVPSSVVEEAGRKGAGERVDYLLEKGRVLEPRAEDLVEVRAMANATGDHAELSSADLDVLALALQLKAVIVTDDYAIQNVASRLGVVYRQALLPGIRERVGWSFRCSGCGRYWQVPMDQCPVCGSAVRRYRRRH